MLISSSCSHSQVGRVRSSLWAEQRHWNSQAEGQGTLGQAIIYDYHNKALKLWPSDEKNWFIGKDLDSGKDWGQEKKGVTEDEMVGWYHGLNGHEFETTLGNSEVREAWPAAVHGVTKSQTWLSDWTTMTIITQATQSKSKTQFQHGIRIGSSLQHPEQCLECSRNPANVRVPQLYRIWSKLKELCKMKHSKWKLKNQSHATKEKQTMWTIRPNLVIVIEHEISLPGSQTQRPFRLKVTHVFSEERKWIPSLLPWPASCPGTTVFSISQLSFQHSIHLALTIQPLMVLKTHSNPF